MKTMRRTVDFAISLVLIAGGILCLLATPVAAGQIHLKYGFAVTADYWWEDGGMLWYVRNGERAAVSRSDVIRIEGVPQYPPGMSWNPQQRAWEDKPNPLTGPPPGPPASVSREPVPPLRSPTALQFPLHTAARCPWRTAPQCIHIFNEGTFKAWGETSGVIRKWIWRLFLANPGPAVAVDLRLEFQNGRLSNDFVKRCGLLLPGTATTEILGEHTIRESAGPAWNVTIEMEPNAKWC